MDGSIYSPGAGHFPPVLAGRDWILQEWTTTLNNVVSSGRVRAQDIILSGPRGVGKTVTMEAMADAAKQQGFDVVNLQAVAGHIGLVPSLMQKATLLTHQESGPWKRAMGAFERLGGLTFSFAGISAGITTKTVPSSDVIDPGILADTLATLAQEIVKDEPQGGLLITVDELQVASASDLALLAATLHRLNVEHPRATVLFIGTGLPHISTVLTSSGVTHPDRLFQLEPLPLTLSEGEARYALIEPARRIGVTWEPEAAQVILDASQGYPAHLQFYADQIWTSAIGPDRITLADAQSGMPQAEATLMKRTLQPRWMRMSDRQMEFLAGLAVLGSSASVSILARTLNRNITDLSWIRDELLKEGDIYSPKRGLLTFTVPAFARFVLQEYEATRRYASTSLLSLGALRQNAETAI